MRAIYLIGGLFLSQVTQAETLTELFQQARHNDAQFIQAQAEWLTQRELYPQARSSLLPKVHATASRSEIDSETQGPQSFFSANGEYSTNDISVNLTQPIYDHGTVAGLKSAKASVRSAETRFRAAEQLLLLNLAETYFNAVVAEDSLRFAKAELKAIERQLKGIKQRFEVGSLAETDVKESQAAYDLAYAQVIEAENALRNAREQLYTMTGSIPALLPLKQEFELTPPVPDEVEHWEQTALKQNADLLSAQSDLKARSEEVAFQRAQRYPYLDLIASYTESEQDGGSFDGTEREDTRLTLQLTVPLYSGGAVSSEVRKAKAQRNAAQSTLEFQRRQAQQSARNAYYNIKAAAARARALKQAVISSKASRDATQAGFDAGTRISTDVLDAEREVLRAERDYARARYDYLLNRLRLKQATGTLAAEDLAAIEQHLGHS